MRAVALPQDNQSYAETDKSQEPPSLCLTRGLGTAVFAERNARGNILET